MELHIDIKFHGIPYSINEIFKNVFLDIHACIKVMHSFLDHDGQEANNDIFRCSSDASKIWM